MKNLFSIQLRGYNPSDVNQFVRKTNLKQQSLKNKLSKVIAQNKKLQKSVNATKAKQNSIGKSLVMSEQLSQKVLDKAHQQGGEYLEHAQTKANNLMTNTKSKASKLMSTTKSNASNVMSSAHKKANKLINDTQQRKNVLLKENLNMYRDIQQFRKDISMKLLKASKRFSAPIWKDLGKKDRRVIAYDAINLSNEESRERILNRKPTDAVVEAKNPSAIKYYPNGKAKSFQTK